VTEAAASAAVEALRQIANSQVPLSDALRSVRQVALSIGASDLGTWATQELDGYTFGDPVPAYRQTNARLLGNVTNGAWFHERVDVSVVLEDEERDALLAPLELRQSVAALEELLSSPHPNFMSPWDERNIRRANARIARGGSPIDSTYWFITVWRDIPRHAVAETLERIRNRAHMELAGALPADQQAVALNDPAAPGPTVATFTVQGDQNQLIVGSPGARIETTIREGDHLGLDQALSSMGIGDEALAELGAILSDSDEHGRLQRALEWGKRVAAELGISTAGSAIAEALLRYMGHL
jgi:hypothetical protein